MAYDKEILQLLCKVEEFINNFDERLLDEYMPVNADLAPVAIKTEEIPQSITGENPFRTELWIHNASDVDLFLGPSEEIGTGKYSTRIAPKDTLILNAHNYAQLYKRQIWGFWDSGAVSTSKAMVTEWSLQQN